MPMYRSLPLTSPAFITTNLTLHNQNLKLTTEKQFLYISLMRKMSVLVLCALIIPLLAPVHVSTASSQSDKTVIFTLDVCGSPGSSLSAHQDMPSLYECPCKINPSGFIGFQNISKSVFSFLLIPSQKERPPKV